MGVLPLEFEPGATWQSLGLTGEEVFDIPELDDSLRPRQTTQSRRHRRQGRQAKSSRCRVRIDTPVELDYYRNGGILQTVLRKLLEDVSDRPVVSGVCR